VDLERLGVLRETPQESTVRADDHTALVQEGIVHASGVVIQSEGSGQAPSLTPRKRRATEHTIDLTGEDDKANTTSKVKREDVETPGIDGAPGSTGSSLQDLGAMTEKELQLELRSVEIQKEMERRKRAKY
jgi:hypothetical protein